jgi:DNA polymerase III alpha subunit
MSTKLNTEQDLIDGILQHGPDILEFCSTSDDISKYISKIEQEKLNYLIPNRNIDIHNWFMPREYAEMDIEEFLVNLCPADNYERLITELQEYRRRNLLDLLRQMKYIVDTLRKNNIVWGVGRGSSVASYVLFLLGVHKVDSVKYSLPIEEFFKGEQNG